MKYTKSLLVIKERNCTASLVLDRRTQRRNAMEFPLSLRFTIDRKFFYHTVGGSYTEKQFSDICNALLDWYTIELFVGILLRYHLQRVDC